MPRPKTKSELLDLSQSNFHKLNDFVENMEIEKRKNDFPQGTMNRNISDVFMHLHHWHLMLMNWYRIGMTGEKPDMPAKGYTWKTLPDLNKSIWERYIDMGLDEAQKHLEASHRDLREIMEGHSNDELFEKKRYKWTGSTSLGEYLISATSSHYDWALKLITKAKKKRQ
ncbi:MAG: hypothetical protein ACI9IP_002619 [Arcticibacterium sp.]|jgi:hypothetical protein